MSKSDWQSTPTAEYRFWLWDPCGDGLMLFRTAADRDEAAAELLGDYLDSEGWAEETDDICGGEITVTHAVTQVDREERPLGGWEDNEHPPECEAAYNYVWRAVK